MDVNRIHQLIQTAIEENYVVLSDNGSYHMNGSECVCLLGALAVGVFGLDAARRIISYEQPNIIATTLSTNTLDLKHLEAGFCGWASPSDMMASTAAYKLGQELFATYV